MTGPSRSLIPSPFLAGLFVALLLCGLPFRTTLRAQEQRKPRVPVIDKITAGGPTQQMFTGIVKSVDLDSKVLSVDNVSGKSTEIFPIRKKVPVAFADGARLKLAELKTGTLVNVYYDQKGDRRTVTRIEVLAAGAAKKKTPPS
jgi:Cu/Ag efflux protein CusF